MRYIKVGKKNVETKTFFLLEQLLWDSEDINGMENRIHSWYFCKKTNTKKNSMMRKVRLSPLPPPPFFRPRKPASDSFS